MKLKKISGDSRTFPITKNCFVEKKTKMTKKIDSENFFGWYFGPFWAKTQEKQGKSKKKHKEILLTFSVSQHVVQHFLEFGSQVFDQTDVATFPQTFCVLC